MSQEMQAIVWFAVSGLAIALAWALWQRTVRQSLTVLFLAMGTILVLSGGIPLIWWQVNGRLHNAVVQTLQMSDHRIASQTQTRVNGYMRLEAEIEITVPKLTKERLQAIAHSYLAHNLLEYKPDIAAVRLKDFSRPLLYEYAYKKSLSFENIRPWIQPTPAELATGAHVEEAISGELGEYHTRTVFVTLTAKWAHLQALLKQSKLFEVWQSLDESLYDYVLWSDGGQPQFLVLFALLDEDFWRQYQAAGGRPQELGLLNVEITTPSLLIIVEAYQEILFRMSDIALVQKRGNTVNRYELGELALNTTARWRPPWLQLDGIFPNFPNTLAHLHPGARIIGLVRFPEGFDPYQGFQVYYDDRVATFGKKL